jgi:hypothetical protein
MKEATMKNITIFTKPSAKALAIEKKLRAELERNAVAPDREVIITIGGDDREGRGVR